MRLNPHIAAICGILASTLIACSGASDDANVARGRGLKPATLTPAALASIYGAAVRASFDPDPALILMAHPRLLPRTEGYAGGDALPAELLRALKSQDVVRGVCEPKHAVARDTPRCPGANAGYVIRASPVYLVGHDTVQINFAAEEFAAQTGTRPEALRFEKIYQLLGSGQRWRVVREARVREPVR